MNSYSPNPIAPFQSGSIPTTRDIEYPPVLSHSKLSWILRRLIRVLLEPFKKASRWKVVPLGKLFTAIPSQRWQIGAFSFDWQGSAATLPHLRIYHDGSGKIVWSTSPGHGFVSAAEVSLAIAEERGSVEMKESKKGQFACQTVEAIRHQDDQLIISGRLSGNQATREDPQYELIFRNSGDKKLNFCLQVWGSGVNQAQLQFLSNPDEHFYGFGEQFSYLDCKGEEVPIICEEGGIGRGDPGPKVLKILGVEGGMFSSYAPSPHFVTNQGRSLFLYNTEPSVFNLRDPEYVSMWVMASAMQGCLLCGDTPLDLIEHYTEIVGRMPPLPDWVHKGAIAGIQGGTQKVRDIWTQLRKFETPIAGFWLQDWVGQRRTKIGKQLWWNWQLAEKHYPGWAELVAEMTQSGIEVGVYINPFLVDLAQLPPEQKDLFLGKRHLFDEAKKQDLLLKNKDQAVYLVQNTDFNAGLLDLSNPAACEWFKCIIKDEVLSTGAKFWMADFAEASQFDAKFHSQEIGLSYHNQYPVTWATLNRQAIQEAGREGDAWFFTRAGFLKTPGHTTGMWLGDQNTTWNKNDGLPSALRGMVTGGFSGFSINHSDIGGYTSVGIPILEWFGRGFRRSRELLFRWMEMNAFTSIFRTHEGNEPDKNIQFYTDDDTLQNFSYWAKVYVALADYRQQLMIEASLKGYPVVRHPILHYPNDPMVYALEDHFMLGSEFLVRPTMELGQTQVSVYFPGGEWVHLWSGKVYGGDRYAPGARYAPSVRANATQTVAAPLGQPAVFFRKGSEVGEAVRQNLQTQGLITEVQS